MNKLKSRVKKIESSAGINADLEQMTIIILEHCESNAEAKIRTGNQLVDDKYIHFIECVRALNGRPDI